MKFVYASSKKPKITIDFTQWDKGEPSNSKGKVSTKNNCVEVKEGKWRASKGAKSKRYVCEMPPDEKQEFWDSVPIKPAAESLKAYIFQKFLQTVPAKDLNEPAPQVPSSNSK